MMNLPPLFSPLYNTLLILASSLDLDISVYVLVSFVLDTIKNTIR